MKRLNLKAVIAEVECPACKGSGFSIVMQPIHPVVNSFRRAARNV
jgi:hypothetical protein